MQVVILFTWRWPDRDKRWGCWRQCKREIPIGGVMHVLSTLGRVFLECCDVNVP